MVDPVSNANSPYESGQSQSRPQPSSIAPVPGAPDPVTGLAPDQRIAALQDAAEKLVADNLPDNSKLQIEQDKETGVFIYRAINPQTGEVLSQWPSEHMVKMGEYLAQVEGMLIDKEV